VYQHITVLYYYGVPYTNHKASLISFDRQGAE
jgi:hypothetical protein